jgi:hypothetical protein
LFGRSDLLHRWDHCRHWGKRPDGFLQVLLELRMRIEQVELSAYGIRRSALLVWALRRLVKRAWEVEAEARTCQLDEQQRVWLDADVS